jgi:hypothetical protein
VDGSRYEGNYKCGMKHGTGTYYWNDGSTYIGEWKENMMNGKVRLFDYLKREFTHGLMGGDMKEVGWTIKCTGLERIFGRTGEVTEGNIEMTRRMVMECTYGQMVEDMKVSGKREGSMGKGNTFKTMGKKN